MSLLLCCDTATPAESVALVRGDAILAERVSVRPKGHGPTLLDTFQELLDEAGLTPGALDGLVCGLGPGSFTGLRVALATLKGAALGLDRPLYGVRTVLAFQAAHPEAEVVAVVDARRGEVFADGAALSAPLSVTPEALAGHLAALPGLSAPARPLRLLGNGATLYAERLLAALPAHLRADVPAEPEAHAPRAALLARAVRDGLAPADLATIEPLYVRPSDAELNYPDGFPDATLAPKQKLPPKRFGVNAGSR